MHPLGGIPPYLSSPPLSSSPPIHRVANKFFDSVSIADRPRAQLKRNSESTTSLAGMGRSFEAEGLSSGTTPVEHVVDLQFEDDHVAPYAHYGYVASFARLRLWKRC